MQVQLKTWGNSQGVRIPKEVLNTLGLSENDSLELRVDEGRIILEKPFRHRSLKERAEAFGGELHLTGDQEFDWGEPEGNEIW